MKNRFLTWFRIKTPDILESLDSKTFPGELREMLEGKGILVDDKPSVRVNRKGRSWSTPGYAIKLTGDHLNIYQKVEVKPRKRRPGQPANPAGSVAYNRAIEDSDLLTSSEVAELLSITPKRVREIFEYSEWHHSFLTKGGRPRAFFYHKSDLLEQMEQQGALKDLAPRIRAFLIDTSAAK